MTDLRLTDNLLTIASKFLRYVDHIDTYADTTLGFKKILLAIFSAFFAHSNNIDRGEGSVSHLQTR